MPFDPSLPAPNSPLQSQVIRDQLQALFNLINGIVTVTAAQVDGVNTLPAGSPANVNVSVNGGTLHLSFDIPQGNDGPTGATGQPGEVSLSDLNAALLTNLNQCSNNSNGVGNLSMNADPNYDQNQMQAVMQKLDELINALRR
jgi:hypothetical protein